ADSGYRVAVADLDAEGAESVAEELCRGGHEAIAIEVDVTDATSAAKLADSVAATFGGIDILVNNAGLFGDPAWTGPVMQVDLDEWDKIFAVNLRGVLVVSRAVAPVMKRADWGRIVNISSMGSHMLGGAYSASKLAVNHLTWSLAAELSGANITV